MTKINIIKATPVANNRALGFAECSYYNGEQPAIVTAARYQLRKSRAGGNGAELVAASDCPEALRAQVHQQALWEAVVWTIYDISTLPAAAFTEADAALCDALGV